jgi:hypothetical protein
VRHLRFAHGCATRAQATWRSALARMVMRRKLVAARRRSERVWARLTARLNEMPASNFSSACAADARPAATQARVEIHLPR